MKLCWQIIESRVWMGNKDFLTSCLNPHIWFIIWRWNILMINRFYSPELNLLHYNRRWNLMIINLLFRFQAPDSKLMIIHYIGRWNCSFKFFWQKNLSFYLDCSKIRIIKRCSGHCCYWCFKMAKFWFWIQGCQN